MQPPVLATPQGAVSPRPSALSSLNAHPRQPARILLFAAALGVMFEVFFDGSRAGVSFPLFVLSVLGAQLMLGGKEGLHRARPNLWLLAPLLFFSAMVAVRDSAPLTALNVLAVGLLFCLWAHFYGADRVEQLALRQYFAVVGATAVKGLLQPPLLMSRIDTRRVQRGLGPYVRPFLRGLFITGPVVLVFAVLLGSADRRFAALLERLWSWGPGMGAGELLGRVAVAVGASFAIAGALAITLRRTSGKELPQPAPLASRLGFFESAMLMGSVNLLFGMFLALQGASLFLGQEAFLEPGLIYSEVARQGFFQLLAVSVLTLLLILALEAWVRRETPRQQLWFRLWCSVMVALTVVLLASALHRMELYQQTYGNTELRLYSDLFMWMLAGVLAWRAVTLWWRPQYFPLGAFLGAIAWLTALNLINPDAYIARKNLEKGKVDVPYLTRLSADAIPVLAGSMEQLDEWQRRTVRHSLREHAAPAQGESIFAVHLSRLRAQEVARELGETP